MVEYNSPPRTCGFTLATKADDAALFLATTWSVETAHGGVARSGSS